MTIALYKFTFTITIIITITVMELRSCTIIRTVESLPEDPVHDLVRPVNGSAELFPDF